jgi:uncharacterized protein YxjI
MKHIKSFQKHNEEISLKGAIATGAVIGGLVTGGAYLHDKNIEPKEITQSNHVDIPKSFQLKKKIISIGTDMYITNDNRDNFGKIEERTLSWGRTFQYYDNTGKILATAKQEVFSFGTKINITDESGQRIGSVEQEIIESMFSLHSIYSIKDKNGELIAKSKKLDFFTSNVDIFDVSGKFVANFDQRAFTISDKWNCKIESTSIDKRLIIFIPSFVSAAQSDKREKEGEK